MAGIFIDEKRLVEMIICEKKNSSIDCIWLNRLWRPEIFSEFLEVHKGDERDPSEYVEIIGDGLKDDPNSRFRVTFKSIKKPDVSYKEHKSIPLEAAIRTFTPVYVDRTRLVKLYNTFR